MRTQRLRRVVLTIVAGLVLATDASADQIQIVLNGLSLAYGVNQDGVSNGVLPAAIYDSGSFGGGKGVPSLATDLSSASFYLDGTLQGEVDVSQGGFARADVFIATEWLPTDGTSVTATLSGRQIFDLLLFDNLIGWGLALTQNAWELRYDSAANSIFGDASAMVCATCSPNQNGLFGLQFDTSAPIAVSFRVTQVPGTVNSDGDPIFVGSATITGKNKQTTVIPEPSSAVLVVLGVGGLIVGFRIQPTVRRHMA